MHAHRHVPHPDRSAWYCWKSWLLAGCYDRENNSRDSENKCNSTKTWFCFKIRFNIITLAVDGIRHLQIHRASPRCTQSGTSLSYCSIPLGQDKISYRGWLCIFLNCISVLSAMLLLMCVWWNINLGDFYVYQCDLEALVDSFKEHVIVSCALSAH